MTLASQMTADVAAVFLDTDDFAETIVYLPLGGSPVSVKAVVLPEDDTLRVSASDGEAVDEHCDLYLASAAAGGVATVKHGDKFERGGKTYVVMAEPEPALYGLRRVRGRLLQPAVKSARDYRKR